MIIYLNILSQITQTTTLKDQIQKLRLVEVASFFFLEGC